MLLRKLCVAMVAALSLAIWAIVPVVARGPNESSYSFATPVFGIDTAFDGSLLVADAGAGIVRLRRGTGSLIAALPGVTDVAPTWFGLLAVTGGATDPSQATPLSTKLFRIARGQVTPVADLGAFEAAVNPDGGVIESNPFDVAALWNGSALVADAAANDLLIVDRKGAVDWVATLPRELVSTDNLKQLSGCPSGPAAICNLPPMIPAEAVPTSVAVGRDGAYYVGELKGFPAPTGRSRIWRIDPGTRHAQCGTSPACTVVADGFTSVVDLTFGLDGVLHVVELDEASFYAVEVAGTPLGGTVDRCERDRWTDRWTCGVEAAGLPMPTAATVDWRGRVHVVTNALVPGAAAIVTLPRFLSQ